MVSGSNSTPQTTSRSIRVFISSTFRDMQEERDELVKRVFPQLRRLCEQRGVAWSEVDLRWGIPEEHKGEVLRICLAEIRNCRPYFIGILGERYGWIPEEPEEEMVREEPWLGEHRSASVTELEILHGVLNDPQTADHAFFYLRDPAYVDSLPAEQQGLFREAPPAEDIARLGEEEALRRNDARRRKLLDLKQRIRASGFPVHENYPGPQALGGLVLKDMAEVIEHLFPEGVRLDALDQEASEHEAFAADRARVYIANEHTFERLDRHAQDDGPPLVVTGEPGIGKSSLLANWVRRYRQMHPQAWILPHYVGSSALSADPTTLQRRILAEFNRRLGLNLTFPIRAEALRLEFATGLHQAAARGQVILVLDGVDHLGSDSALPELLWLPRELPRGIRLLISASPSPALDELSRRGWPMLTLEPLDTAQRVELIHAFLAHYSKTLSPARTARVAGAAQAGNPRYLRAVLDELRLFGIHERLDERIEHYMGATTTASLLETVLDRYAQDYEKDRTGLVREALGLIWASRRGLAEAELLDLLGSDGQPIPHAYWSPLLLALGDGLLWREGLIRLAHDDLRQAVEGRFLSTLPLCQAAHLRLADYFEGHEHLPRKAEELPWQLYQANAWPRLYQALSEPPMLDAVWDASEHNAHFYWAQVEENSPLRMLDGYRSILDAPQAHDGSLWRIAQLLQNAGHPREALVVQEHLIRQHGQSGDPHRQALALESAAVARSSLGDLEGALQAFQASERLSREIGDRPGIARSLHNQASLLHLHGDLDRALSLYQEQEQIWRELGDRISQALSMNNRGNILRDRGDLPQARLLFEGAAAIARELGHPLAYAQALDGQATVLMNQADFPAAAGLLREEEGILRSVGSRERLATCLGNQAIAEEALGRHETALALYSEQERICRAAGDVRGLAESLGRQGVIRMGQGDLEGAMSLYLQQESICRRLGLRNELQVSLGNQAIVVAARGDMEGALALHKEKEQICRELGNLRGLGIALGNQANILTRRRNLDGALALHQEKERIDRQIGNVAGLAHCLGNQASIWVHHKEFGRALAMLQEQEQLCRQLGNSQKLADSLKTRAIVLASGMGRTREALPLAEEALQLAYAAGDRALAAQIGGLIDALRRSSGSIAPPSSSESD